LCFDPAAWTEGFVGFSEVFGPIADGYPLTVTAVDQIDGAIEDPRLVDVIDSELVVMSGIPVMFK